MVYLFLAAYGLVFFAELIGDKAIYTISTLVTRFNPISVFCGIVVAFMGKMLVAVLLGQVISELPKPLVAAMSAITFFLMALFIWMKKPKKPPTSPLNSVFWLKGLLISFAAIFFSEWGDIGQITTATLVASYQQPLVIWIAATLAMVTKGALAIGLGLGLRRYVPRQALRYAALSMCLIMGIISALALSI